MHQICHPTFYTYILKCQLRFICIQLFTHTSVRLFIPYKSGLLYHKPSNISIYYTQLVNTCRCITRLAQHSLASCTVLLCNTYLK